MTDDATRLFDRVLYGGDWNPEQWDAKVVDEDLEMMREAGVNVVSLGIFSWARLEPEPGRYDFGWLRTLMDRCHEAGIGVDLATGTASPPVWMARRDPESLPMNAAGTRLEFGSRQQYCPSSVVYREASRALAGALAAEFKDHPALIMWHVNNEYGCHTNKCYCPACTVAFQDWLRGRYGDIETLNHAWYTDFWSQRYTDFGQIHTPAQMPVFANPGQLMDFWRFSDEALLSLYRAEADAIREHTPHLPVTTNFMGDFLPVNYREWAKYVDVVTDDSYPDPALPGAAHEVAFTADLMRSCGGGRPFLLMEQTTGMVQWRPQNPTKRAGQFKLWSLTRLARGADGIMHFQWRQSGGGAEAFHSGMVSHSGRQSRIWPQVVELGAALSNLAPLTGGRVDAQVAVVGDWESARALHLSVGPTEFPPYLGGARQWHRTVWETNLACDVIGVEDPLDAYRVIIVPELAIDYPDFTARLRAAAERGAQVIVAAPAGLMSADLRVILGGYGGGLGELTGVKATDLALQSPGSPNWAMPYQAGAHPVADRITRAVGVPAQASERALDCHDPALERALGTLGDPTPSARAGLWGEYVSLAGDVQVAATYAESDLAGEPAITRRPVGEGCAWYVATNLDPVGRAGLLRTACAYARVSLAKANLPDGVEYARRGDFEFYLNHGDRAVELAGITGKDHLSGEELTGHVVIAPRSGIAVKA